MWISRLLLAALCAGLPNSAAGDLKIDLWLLTNTQFYEDLTPENSPGRRLYRLKRAAVADEGGERCAKEWQESVARKKEIGPFCRALFTEIAPTFRAILHSGEPGEVVLQAVDVDVKSATVLKGGHAWFTGESGYDLFIKAAPGRSSLSLRKPLKFTTLGSVDLRLGFDLSPLGKNTPAAAIEFVLTFRVEGRNGIATADTRLIRIEM